jgi:hypothetical protein
VGEEEKSKPKKERKVSQVCSPHKIALPPFLRLRRIPSSPPAQPRNEATQANEPDRLPLLLPPAGNVLILRLGPVEDLEELGDAMAHAGVHVRFRTFDVVVKVVSEELDVRRRVSSGLGGEVAGEENWLREGGIVRKGGGREGGRVREGRLGKSEGCWE